MKKISLLNLIISLWVSISFMQPAVATEPNIADYTAYPIFMVQAVKPNIMIILDNSGSMKDSDPTNLRFTGARLFISLLDNGDSPLQGKWTSHFDTLEKRCELPGRVRSD